MSNPRSVFTFVCVSTALVAAPGRAQSAGGFAAGTTAGTVSGDHVAWSTGPDVNDPSQWNSTPPGFHRVIPAKSPATSDRNHKRRRLRSTITPGTINGAAPAVAPPAESSTTAR